jgi:hypothetical protein
METTRSGRDRSPNAILILLVLGSLWGLSEVILNDVIRSSGLLPYRAAILTGIGVLCMGAAIGFLRRPLVLLGMPVVAILMKQMVVPILGVSVLCKMNSCIAVAIQGTVLAGIVRLWQGRVTRSRWARVGTGASAGLLSAVPFYLIGLQAAPCAYLLSFSHPGGLVSFLTHEGLVWAGCSGILFPVGYWLGSMARNPAESPGRQSRLAYNGVSAALVVGSWVGAALFISAAG